MSINEMEQKLLIFKNMKLDNINKNEIDNIDNIKYSKSDNKVDRIVDFIERVKNPYAFIVNDHIVKISYKNSDYTFNDKYLMSVKDGI